MGKDRTRHARKGRPIPVSYEDEPAGARGRRHTRGTPDAEIARKDRTRATAAPTSVPPGELDLRPEREAAEMANEGEALSGSGRAASGSLPGSVGGTTGTAGENAGVRSPGAAVPDFPGISPGEAKRLRNKRR